MNFSRDSNANLFHAPFVHPVSQLDGTCLVVVPRATACAGIAWLSHKRRLRTGIVVVVEERTVVEVVYGGGSVVRKTDRRSEKWGPCLRRHKRPSIIGEREKRQTPAGEREQTRRNQSGPVTRSRGEERGPTRTTATHCPTHQDRRCSCFYLSIQETYRDTFNLHSLICLSIRRPDRSKRLDTGLHSDS